MTDTMNIKAHQERKAMREKDTELSRLAKAIIDNETRSRSPGEAGSLYFPWTEPYLYDPFRLIRDDKGHVIEQDKATPAYKFAESNRAAQHLQEAAQWAERTRKEAQEYARWVIEQREQGRTEKLTFGDYVREAKIFQPTV